MNYYDAIKAAGDRPLYEAICTQSPYELESLIDVFKGEGVKSFLEVGSRYGGSLWKIATSLPLGSRIVSIDSGHGLGGTKPQQEESLLACVDKLNQLGYDAHLFFGKSGDKTSIKFATRLGPFDACFIDADHTLDAVTGDWQNYGPLCRLVAFHDIAWVKPENYAESHMVEVPVLWDLLSHQYQCKSWKDPAFNFGIGVLWR